MTTLKTSSRRTSKKTLRKSPLIGSATSTQRELSVLRRARERLENQPRPDETSARTTVAARRTGKS